MKLGIGFIGAAEIAKKNARAISLAECDIGEPLTLHAMKMRCSILQRCGPACAAIKTLLLSA